MSLAPGSMRIGAAFPTTRIGTDPIAVRDFAQGVEGLGYAFIEAYDHVLGASREVYPDFSGPYSTEDPFYEVFVLFGYLANQKFKALTVYGPPETIIDVSAEPLSKEPPPPPANTADGRLERLEQKIGDLEMALAGLTKVISELKSILK